MKFSFVRILKEDADTISGYWLQDHIGTIESAQEKAREIESANGNRIKVAVVSEIPSTRPDLGFWTDLKKVGEHG